MFDSFIRALSLVLFGLLIGALGASLAIVRMWPPPEKETTPKDDSRVAQKLGANKIRMNATLAASHGIEAGPAKAIDWHPKLVVDGRVLVNPHATLEVRAPFAGVMSSDTLFRLGSAVKAHQQLALFEARFSPLEKLDLTSKALKAEEEYKGSEKVLKVRQDHLQRLEQSPAGSISRANLDAAAIQFAEARMQKDITLAQWNLWKQALESVGKKSIIVPIQAPISGEIAEIGAQPGANVQAGQLLVRLVDFRRVLIRLDFPLSNGTAPPDDIEIETPGSFLETPARRRAHLRGPAPSVEIGLQKAGYLYEIVPHEKDLAPNWRPGLYVKAALNDPARSTESAIEFSASALLVHQGRTLVYLKIDDDRYERREVQLLGREGDMVYVSAKGWGPSDDRVVTKRAQVLLSEEFRSDVDDD